MDNVGEEVEQSVNDAIRYPFNFHGINKIVIRLGPVATETPDYIELLGVGRKQYPNFDARRYILLSEYERRDLLFEVVKSVFAWFLLNFDDADFVKIATQKLGWELGAEQSE